MLKSPEEVKKLSSLLDSFLNIAQKIGLDHPKISRAIGLMKSVESEFSDDGKNTIKTVELPTGTSPTKKSSPNKKDASSQEDAKESGAPNSSSSHQRPDMSRYVTCSKIWIGNIASSCPTSELIALFKSIGEIKEEERFSLSSDSKFDSMVINYEDIESAKTAVNTLDSKLMAKNKLLVVGMNEDIAPEALYCNMCQKDDFDSQMAFLNHLATELHKEARTTTFKRNDFIIKMLREDAIIEGFQIKYKYNCVNFSKRQCDICKTAYPELPVKYERKSRRLHVNTTGHRTLNNFINKKCCDVHFNRRRDYEEHCQQFTHMKYIYEKKKERDQMNFVSTQECVQLRRKLETEKELFAKSGITYETLPDYDPSKPVGLEQIATSTYTVCNLCPDVGFNNSMSHMRKLGHWRSPDHYLAVLNQYLKENESTQGIISQDVAMKEIGDALSDSDEDIEPVPDVENKKDEKNIKSSANGEEKGLNKAKINMEANDKEKSLNKAKINVGANDKEKSLNKAKINVRANDKEKSPNKAKVNVKSGQDTDMYTDEMDEMINNVNDLIYGDDDALNDTQKDGRNNATDASGEHDDEVTEVDDEGDGEIDEDAEGENEEDADGDKEEEEEADGENEEEADGEIEEEADGDRDEEDCEEIEIDDDVEQVENEEDGSKNGKTEQQEEAIKEDADNNEEVEDGNKIKATKDVTTNKGRGKRNITIIRAAVSKKEDTNETNSIDASNEVEIEDKSPLKQEDDDVEEKPSPKRRKITLKNTPVTPVRKSSRRTAK